MKKVRDYMKRDVVTFSPEESIFDVAETFAKLNISGAPIVENGKVIGIISETDIVKFMKSDIAPSSGILVEHPEFSLTLTFLDLVRKGISISKELKKVSKIKVRDVMSKSVISISPDANIFDAAELMEKKKVHRLVVMEEGKLIGIISKADLLKALVE